jgi:hypothetical protein
MKNIRFTQSLNMAVTIEASVPDDYTDDDIFHFANEFSLSTTVDVPDYPAYDDDNYEITGLSLDGVTIVEAYVWDGVEA